MKNLILAIFTLVAVTLTGVFTGSPNLVTSVSSQENGLNNEVVFSIPVGDKGIHYEGADNPDMLTWGPPAFTVAPDGNFWIADTPGNHLLRFSSEGVLLDKIIIDDSIIGAGDLEVTSKEIWILDMASIPPKVVHLSFDGKVLNSYHLPKGLYLEDGLSGIAVGSDGNVLVERFGGHALTQFVSSSGKIEQKSLEGYEFKGNVYQAYPADMREKEASYGYILAGEKRIEVEVLNDLGGLSILHINPDGGFFAKVTELVLNVAFQVDQKVYRYDPLGNLVGMARVPLAERYVPVKHSIAVGPDCEVYSLVTKPDGVEIQRLIFRVALLPILAPPMTKEVTEVSLGLSYTEETCRSRADVIGVASSYLNNSTYLNSYHINDNPACTGRVKPEYLVSAGTYSSVPYAWDMWDTVAQFNYYMSGGQNGYFAGNISEIYKSCARGVDCSGLVSRAWDLGSHYGTCTLESISIVLPNPYMLQPGDIMNRCSILPRHSIIFKEFSGDGMTGYESTIEFNSDKVVSTYREFDDIATYIPRRYNNICNKIHLPVIMKAGVEMRADSPSTNPYPSPDSYQSLNPYP